MREIGIALGTLIASAAVVAVWDTFTDGGLIRVLGGATAEQVEKLEERLIDPSDIEFTVRTRSLQQANAQVGGETILNALVCPPGWLNGPAFTESYQSTPQGETRLAAHQKYLRLCFRARPASTETP